MCVCVCVCVCVRAFTKSCLNQWCGTFLEDTSGDYMCVLICSVLCCWLGVGGGGRILLGSNPLALLCFFLWVLREGTGKDWPVFLERLGEGLQQGPTFSFPHFKLGWDPGLLHSWGCLESCGVSVRVCFELVYSVLPGALVNDVDHASLFFVHLF